MKVVVADVAVPGCDVTRLTAPGDLHRGVLSPGHQLSFIWLHFRNSHVHFKYVMLPPFLSQPYVIGPVLHYLVAHLDLVYGKARRRRGDSTSACHCWAVVLGTRIMYPIRRV